MSFQLRNESNGDIHPLEDKRISIGSADTSNIPIKEEGVPPTLCFLSKTKLGYFLMSFSPSSPVTINGEALKEKMLKPGDRLEIGSTHFILEEQGAPAAEKAEEAPPAEKAEEAPPAEKAEEAPPAEKAEEKPAEEKAEEAPAEEKPEEAPAAEKAEESPPAEKAEEKPAEEKAEEKPAEEKAEEKPAEEKPEEAPAAEKGEESPPAPWEVSPEIPEQKSEPSPPPGEKEGDVALSPEEAEKLFGGVSEKKGTGEPPVSEAISAAPFALLVRGGSKDGETVPISERLTVGRADENNLVLLSKSVSRRHGEFFFKEGNLYVQDLGSASGIKVNGARVKEDGLTEGDQVEIGDIILVVKKSEAPEPAPVPEPAAPVPEETPKEEEVLDKPKAAALKPLVMVMGGALDGKVVPIVGKLSLGSAPESDLVFPDPGIQPKHAEFFETDGAVGIRPGEGIVRVNGAELEKEEYLAKGDAIEIGDILLVVRESVSRVKGPVSEPAPEPEVAPAPGPEAPGAEPPKKETPPLGMTPLTLEEGKPAPAPDIPPEEAKFRVVVKGGIMDGKSFPITGAMTLGRESGNQIVLLDAAVSRKHAKVAPEEGGVRITDIGSTGGVWVNGKKVPEALMSHGDLIRIGHTEIQVRDISYDLLPDTEKPPLPSSLNAVKLSKEEVPSAERYAFTFLKGDDEGCHFELRGNTTIGRHKSCDVVIHHEEASGKHAEIIIDGKRPMIKDHGSTNGTRVNGTRINERFLFHGDVIDLANGELLFREPGRPIPPSGVRRPSLIMREKGKEKPTRYKLALFGLIGREEACSIPLRDEEASSEHASIFERDGAYFVKDHHSTNGTKVKGSRISAETRLAHADTIVIGTTQLQFKEADKALPQPSTGTSPVWIAVAASAVVLIVAIGLAFVFKDKLFPPPDSSGPGDQGGTKVMGKNLLSNGSFESMDEGWILRGGEAEVTREMAHGGKNCLLISGGASKSADRDVEIKARYREQENARYYKVDGFVRTEGSKGYSGIRLRWTDGTKPIPSIPDTYTELMTGTTEDWIQIGGTFTPPAKPPGVAVMYLELALVGLGVSGKTWFDDISLVRLAQEDLDLRLRPKLETATNQYILRAAESGVFSMEYFGQSFLHHGHLRLELHGERGASQKYGSITEGPLQRAPGSYHLKGRLVDFSSGEEAKFEQNLSLSSTGNDIQIHYFLTRLPSGGGYTLAINLSLTEAPERFNLFDKKNSTLEFEGGFDPQKEIMEVKWPVPGGEKVILTLDPPSGIEVRRRAEPGGGVDLRILPPLSAGAQVTLTFGKTSKAGEFAKKQQFDEFVDLIKTKQLGLALQKGRAYMKAFPDLDMQYRTVKSDTERIEGEAKDKRDLWESKWKEYESQRDSLELEKRRERLQEVITQCGDLAEAFRGSEFEGPFRTLFEKAKSESAALILKNVAAEAKKYLDPARKGVESGNLLKARIYLDNLAAQGGLLENLPPDLKQEYDRLLKACQKAGEGVDVEALFEQAEELVRQGEKEKAKEIYRKIISLFPDHAQDPEEYSETALRAFKALQALK
ncbi:MAG: FHA domain-containing protein [Planctomycetota bacterium]|jgi:pSer/pThr/pTyr-binding forkhead associated (FHA) protein